MFVAFMSMSFCFLEVSNLNTVLNLTTFRPTSVTKYKCYNLSINIASEAAWSDYLYVFIDPHTL